MVQTLLDILNQYSNAIIAIFTAFTVIIAFFELSQRLRGPDIKICEKPEFVLDRIPQDYFNHFIPDRFGFTPTRLVYLNHGPRTGAFRPNIEFNCSKEFRPFFKMHDYSLKIDGKQLEKTTYVPIRDKECLIVEVNSSLKFCDWKKNFDFKPVKPDRIKDVLCQADQQNKKRFSDFCSTLKPGMPIGRIDIRTRQTIRERIGRIVMKEKKNFPNLDGGVIDEELVGNFQSCLKRWDDIEPDYILKRVGEIQKDLNKELYEPLEMNFKRFFGVSELTSPEYRPLKYDLLSNWTRTYEGYETKKDIADFLIRSMELDTQFSEYEAEVRKVNGLMELNLEIFSAQVSVEIEKMRESFKNGNSKPDAKSARTAGYSFLMHSVEWVMCVYPLVRAL